MYLPERLSPVFLLKVLMYWPTNSKEALCVRQTMVNVQPPTPQRCYQPLSLCRTWEKCLFWRKKVDCITGFHALTQLPRSCKTGCSIVNYLKNQTQHIFSPCSPCDELADPQTYRPLSADEETSCLLRLQKTAHHPADRRLKKTPLTLSPLLLNNLLHKCFEASPAPPCHLCILNFVCCMHTKRCPVAHIAQKKQCDQCYLLRSEPDFSRIKPRKHC